MKLSQYSIKELLPYVLGDDSPNNYHSGKDLVNLFNRVNIRDVYDDKAGGLPLPDRCLLCTGVCFIIMDASYDIS